MKGTCRFCGCTDAQACEGGCSWVDEQETTCSRCGFAETLALTSLPLFASLAMRVMPAATATWADLSPKHQQLMVMALRALQEGIASGLREELGLDEATASRDLYELALHIIEKFPDERDRVYAGDETIVDVTIRLLNQAKPATTIVTG